MLSEFVYSFIDSFSIWNHNIPKFVSKFYFILFFFHMEIVHEHSFQYITIIAHFSLGQYTTVLEAEVYAIKACTVENLDRKYKIETSIFHQIVELQREHLANTRSPQNWSGTAINP
jgi:hypothetical protein